jgi:hypothetical protein
MLPTKPKNWFPHLSLLLTPLLLNYLTLLYLPITPGTASFPATILLTKLLTLAPLLLPANAPPSWGTVPRDPHSTHPAITTLFNTIATASALLHAKTTLAALLYNLPDSHKHRHSSIVTIPFFDTEKRSQWERTATAVEKVLGAMADHPAVAAAGKDVLLCALGLGLWAAVRGADVGGMVRVVWPGFLSGGFKLRGRGGLVKTEAETSSHGGDDEEEREGDTNAGGGGTAAAVPPLSMTLRRRGRPKKTSVSSVGSSNGNHEDATAATVTPKRRGRPRKVKPEPEPEPDLDMDMDMDLEEVPGDKTYEPTPAVRADAALGDVLPEDDFDWEPAALAWGLTALAGLGVGSAAVFGGECVSR